MRLALYIAEVDYLLAGVTLALSFLLIVIASRAYSKSGLKILRPLLIVFALAFLASVLISLNLLGVVSFPYYDSILMFLFLSILIMYLYLLSGLN